MIVLFLRYSSACSQEKLDVLLIELVLNRIVFIALDIVLAI